MNCNVVVEAAIPVYNVESNEEAIQIAISKAGNMLNPDMNYVEIEPRYDDEDRESAFIIAEEALVGLKLEMTVFNVDEVEHAERIARTEIGKKMNDIPLEVISVEEFEEEEDEDEDEDELEGEDEEVEENEEEEDELDGEEVVTE